MMGSDLKYLQQTNDDFCMSALLTPMHFGSLYCDHGN